MSVGVTFGLSVRAEFVRTIKSSEIKQGETSMITGQAGDGGRTRDLRLGKAEEAQRHSTIPLENEGIRRETKAPKAGVCLGDVRAEFGLPSAPRGL